MDIVQPSYNFALEAILSFIFHVMPCKDTEKGMYNQKPFQNQQKHKEKKKEDTKSQSDKKSYNL